MKNNSLICGSLFALLHMQSAMATNQAPLIEIDIVQSNSIWNDSGSGADGDVSIWRPIASPGYYPLGDVAIAGYTKPSTIVVKGLDPGVLAKPTGYTRTWIDAGSGANADVAFWRPLPPSGYRCLGDVATNNHNNQPSTDLIRCVREDVTVATNSHKVWDDTGSGADNDISLFEVVTPWAWHQSMISQPGHVGSPGTIYSLIDNVTISSADAFISSIRTLAKTEDILKAYNPVWHFTDEQDSQIVPIDIDQSFSEYAHLQRLECDAGKFRLVYNNDNGRNYRSKTNGLNRAVTYGFAQPVDGGFDLHYYLYYPYNVANPVLNTWDHEGDWEGVRISLRVDKSNGSYYLKPTEMKTQAHGNNWTNAWDSGEVWLANPSEYTDSTGDTVSHHDNLGNLIKPPRVFVAEDSNGTYPNTNHERGIFNHPGPNSYNRTCVDGHSSAFCDFVDTSSNINDRVRYPVYPIVVNKESNNIMSYKQIQHNVANDVNWLNTDTSCVVGAQTPSVNNLTKGIDRWGYEDGPQGIQVRGDVWANTLSVDYGLQNVQFTAPFRLDSGESVLSADKQYRLIMQADGNLVLYTISGAHIWSTATHHSGATHVIFQTDGNLVVYTPTIPVWASHTWGNSGASMIFHNEGYLAIVASSGTKKWSTPAP